MSMSSESMDRAVRRLDAWRRSPLAPPSEQGSYKEWFHFCVRLPGDPPGHLLVNFNVTERRLANEAVRFARVLTLANAGQWCGHVESVPSASVHGEAGDVDCRFGASSLTLAAGVFSLKLRSGRVAAELVLRPLTPPTGMTSISFDVGHAMQWVAVSRLVADGHVSIEGRRFALVNAPAYHDHNWGDFRWGADLAWDWGFVQPFDVGCPWSVVFVRVSDGARHRTLSQGVLVWRGETYVRAFQNRELDFDTRGSHAGARPLTLPGVMGLLAPGAASGVPAELSVHAQGAEGELSLEYETRSKARIVVPSDTNPFRVVFLNETEGTARVHGRLGDEVVDFEGSAIVEFVRA